MRTPTLAALALLAACNTATAPQWEGTPAVQLNGFYYLQSDAQAIPPGSTAWQAQVGPAYGTVLRRLSCDGVHARSSGYGVVDPCGMKSGDSNALDAGTTLYADAALGPQRLLAVADGRLLFFTGVFPPD